MGGAVSRKQGWLTLLVDHVDDRDDVRVIELLEDANLTK